MLWLKGCPRCSGDLKDSRDFYGSYVMCLQCGYHVLDPPVALLQGHEVEMATRMASDERDLAAAS